MGPAGSPTSRRVLARCHGNLPSLCLPARSRDWPEALRWYSTALDRTDDDEGGEYDGVQDEPRHALLAREAEMLSAGGHGLQKDPQRAGARGWPGAHSSCAPESHGTMRGCGSPSSTVGWGGQAPARLCSATAPPDGAGL